MYLLSSQIKISEIISNIFEVVPVINELILTIESRQTKFRLI